MLRQQTSEGCKQQQLQIIAIHLPLTNFTCYVGLICDTTTEGEEATSDEPIAASVEGSDREEATSDDSVEGSDRAVGGADSTPLVSSRCANFFV